MTSHFKLHSVSWLKHLHHFNFRIYYVYFIFSLIRHVGFRNGNEIWVAKQREKRSMHWFTRFLCIHIGDLLALTPTFIQGNFIVDCMTKRSLHVASRILAIFINKAWKNMLRYVFLKSSLLWIIHDEHLYFMESL